MIVCTSPMTQLSADMLAQRPTDLHQVEAMAFHDRVPSRIRELIGLAIDGAAVPSRVIDAVELKFLGRVLTWGTSPARVNFWNRGVPETSRKLTQNHPAAFNTKAWLIENNYWHAGQ